jgi:hypothetical protein
VLLLLVEAKQGVDGSMFADISKGCARAVRAATGLAPDIVQVLTPGTLPRTSSGKLRRRESLRRWLSGELLPPKSVTPLSLAGVMARSSLARMGWDDGD